MVENCQVRGGVAGRVGQGSDEPAVAGEGSYRSEATGQPANLLAASDYPVTAECNWCHGKIRLSRKNQMEWVHDTTAPAPTAGDAL